MSESAGIHRVISDVWDLCELQIQLLAVDSQVARRKATQAIVCGVLAASMMAAGLTVLFAGLGLLLSDSTPLSVGVSLLIVSSIALAIVVSLFAMAAFALRAAGDSLGETKTEFTDNVRWLKTTLIGSENSPRSKSRSENAETPGSPSDQQASEATRFRFHPHKAPLNTR